METSSEYDKTNSEEGPQSDESAGKHEVDELPEHSKELEPADLCDDNHSSSGYPETKVEKCYTRTLERLHHISSNGPGDHNAKKEENEQDLSISDESISEESNITPNQLT